MSAASSAFHGVAEHGAAGTRFKRSLAQTECGGFALVITAGMHKGACLRSRECMRLGASVENDLILRDPGMRELHAEIARWNGVWAVLFSDGQSTRALPPLETLQRGRFLRQRFGLGGADLVLTQRTASNLSPRGGRTWSIRAGVLTSLVVLALTFAIGIAWSTPRSAVEREVPGFKDLSAQGWSDVRLAREGQDAVTVSGYVDDAEQMQRLRHWLETQALGSLNWQVRSGAESLNLVQQALAAPEVTLEYIGAGRVRAQGTVTDLGLRDRLRLVANDLAGIVSIDDRLAVVDARATQPRMRPLPFRILDVAPGPLGYFRTDSGARYFVGATLSDGAEVVEITMDAIEFRIGERQVLYPLK